MKIEQREVIGKYNDYTRDELIAEIDREIAKVPDRYQHTVKFIVDDVDDGYESSTKLLIRWERDDTEAEIAEEVRLIKLREDRERKDWERLNSKFGKQS